MSKKTKIFLFEEKSFKNLDDLIQYQFDLNDSCSENEEYYFIINKTLMSNQFFLEVYRYDKKIKKKNKGER